MLAEQREFADRLGDPCDPVPTYTTRSLIPFTKAAFPKERVVAMRGAAGIGVDLTTGGPPFAALSGNFDVGMRVCDCRTPGGGSVDLANCVTVLGLCDWAPAEYGSSAVWRPVTTRTGTTVVPPGTPKDGEITRFFDGTISCPDDPVPLDFTTDEPCRIGPANLFYWHFANDLSLASGEKFAGAFWSHTLTVGGITKSDRDAKRALRDSYAYVKAPLDFIALPPLSASISRRSVDAPAGVIARKRHRRGNLWTGALVAAGCYDNNSERAGYRQGAPASPRRQAGTGSSTAA